MRLAETVTFGGSARLDRTAQLRAAPETLATLADDARARVLLMWRGKPLLVQGGQDPRLGWSRRPVAADAGCGPLLFLGLDEGAPRFAAELRDWPGCAPLSGPGGFGDDSVQPHPALSPDLGFADLRGVMARLEPHEAELAATARGLLEWHRTHGFCARCGAASQSAQGGWQRHCPSCGASHFPRTDPVVIMLITHGNEVLLGRSPGWPEGMFSLLAGFVEPGETVEAAVRREVREESGVVVGPVRYLASQPWPFPASLMIGCRGEALETAITIDPTEIDEALWVSREDVALAFAGDHPRIAPPREGAIARFLLANWLADRLD
ncbi:NAD(+) diphosphatase [Profundibacterium mesophilum]|uniref:NAD(+) diphosphatase n=1 Tax=Profundibacterium mesophilum KAUST100406-0324 TaxID=1037889 RepID=A0A921NQQ2_9RHOB|nr:NAD(+) diphosphatase [Profundibacterium mesophilum]KAF0676612.1 NAD+ diphosphatase [Profundibacterium mesophilum KAUST100406-0324]